jgi:hypothetical protein
VEEIIMAYHSVKALQRKLRKLEKDYEKASIPNKGFAKRGLLMARTMFYYEKYNKRLNAMLDDPARGGSANKKTRVVSGRVDGVGDWIGKKFVVCQDTSKKKKPRRIL